jgi:hypothetical protein
MQPEEASDTCRLDFCLTELQPKDTPINQLRHENRFVGCSGISSARIDRDNKLERPVGKTATNVTSRANNRTIATTHNASFALDPRTEWKYHPNWSKIHRTFSFNDVVFLPTLV